MDTKRSMFGPAVKEAPKEINPIDKAWGITPGVPKASAGIGPFLSRKTAEEGLSAVTEISAPAPDAGNHSGLKAPPKEWAIKGTPPTPKEEPITKSEPKEWKITAPKEEPKSIGPLIEIRAPDKTDNVIQIPTLQVIEEPKEVVRDVLSMAVSNKKERKRLERTDEFKEAVQLLQGLDGKDLSASVDAVRKVVGLISTLRGQSERREANESAAATREMAKAMQALAEALNKPRKITVDKDGVPTGIE